MPFMQESGKHNVVVITGAGSGIGRALSRKFGRSGSNLGLIDMDGPSVSTLADELSGNETEALAVECDVSDQQAAEEAIQGIIRRFGGIDVLINNAGITQRGAFVENRMSVYRRVMDVNFFGSLYCTNAAMDSLMRRKGSIVVMESIAGVSPLVGRTGYCASKHALHGFFTSLRCEVRSSGVHVMIVCPGFVETNLQDRALGSDGKVAGRRRAIVGKQTTPEQVAEDVYKGILKKKPLLVLTPIGKLGYWINRLSPGLYERLMTRKFREEISR